MSEFLWSRHANPWSVWTAVVAFPLLVLALYQRSRLLLGGVLLFVPLNPLLFRPPSDDRACATRVVLGEQVWLDRGVLPSREAAMAAASLDGLPRDVRRGTTEVDVGDARRLRALDDSHAALLHAHGAPLRRAGRQRARSGQGPVV